VAEHHGVGQLHVLEAAVLLGALASEDPSVIAAACSVIDNRWCRDAMARRADVVVLDAPTEVIAARRHTGSHRRDIDSAAYAALIARRAPLLAAAADVRLDATETPQALAATIAETFVADTPAEPVGP